MKKILIPVSIIAVLLCTAAKDADQTVISPDRLFLADNGNPCLLPTEQVAN